MSTGTSNKFPTFLVLGAQKAGTTWLHRVLSQHPDVFMPVEKELHFFSHRSKVDSDVTRSHYVAKFQNAKPNQLIGEATPGYFWSTDQSCEYCRPYSDHNPEIAKSVLSLLGGELKFLVTLRDPVERAVSAYFHHVRMGRVAPDQTIFDKDLYFTGILDIGFYYRHMGYWHEQFSRGRFMVFTLEGNIKRAPAELARNVFGFLNQNVDFVPEGLGEQEFQGLARTESASGERVVETEGGVYRVSQEDIERLREVYLSDVEQLRDVLQVDIRHWPNFSS